ncbi:hypothetical protein C1646_37975 [Rhizophagus diaphanus]|nr:hypothetical protein C1646_37975 [Rhizophagus diaphanus] [Rhizophagus sp. MUCL 43196]
MLNDELVDTAQTIGETFYGVEGGNIRVAVNAPEQPGASALTEQELLRTVLSVPKMHPIKTKSTTKAATRKILNMPVLAWDDFLTNAFYASTALDTSNRIFGRPNVTGGLSVEDSVVDIFLKTMEATNNQRLILLAMPERWSKRYVFRAVKGQPDAIRCGAGNIQLLNDSDASLILSAVEVKPEQLMRTLVADGTELFNAYNTALTTEDDGTTAYTRHQKIIRIVRQLFGYMVVNDLKYGLLTTYIRTWFFIVRMTIRTIFTFLRPFISIKVTQVIVHRSLNVCIILKIYLQQIQLYILHHLILMVGMMKTMTIVTRRMMMTRKMMTTRRMMETEMVKIGTMMIKMYTGHQVLRRKLLRGL